MNDLTIDTYDGKRPGKVNVMAMLERIEAIARNGEPNGTQRLLTVLALLADDEGVVTASAALSGIFGKGEAS